MGKGWGPGAAGAGYTSRSCHSTTPAPYGWAPTGQPNVACRAPPSACEPRWALEMVATVEVAVARLRLAIAAGPTLACSTSQ